MDLSVYFSFIFHFFFLFFSDGMGGFNNVLKVDQTDVEVLKALDVDTASQKLTVPVESKSNYLNHFHTSQCYEIILKSHKLISQNLNSDCLLIIVYLPGFTGFFMICL